MQFKALNVLLIFSFLYLLIGGCGQNKRQEQAVEKPGNYEEQLITANKKAIKTERQQIDDFVRRHHWKLKETGTGLLYSIYESGTGARAETGKRAVIDYTVSSIAGDVFYSSDERGPLEFTIGKSDVPSGLVEGILLMRVGDRAKFIIPSHLAFGLPGDQEKIPPKATLIYDVKLLELK